jgi:predicted enzyme related to lactoylglutathione lyase
MITAIHNMIYSDDAPATRAFLRDVLGWPYVEHADSEPGWLIFKAGSCEMGVHPTSSEWEGKVYTHPKHHSISLMCDNLEATVQELKAKGASFTGEMQNMGFGLVINVQVPGADDIMLYQPMHPTAYNL